MNAAQTHERLKFSYATLRKWHHLFQANDLSWAVSDDEQFIERQKALALFQEGRGYKFVASALGVSQSRTKYWMNMFKSGQLSFFFEGSKRPKCYDETFRNQILRLFFTNNSIKKSVFIPRWHFRRRFEEVAKRRSAKSKRLVLNY